MSDSGFAPPPGVRAAPDGLDAAPHTRAPGRRRGSRRVVLAWVVGGAALLAVLGGVIASVLLDRDARALDPIERGDTGTVPAVRAIAGLCLVDPVDDGATVGRVTSIACSEPHHAEIVAQATLADGAWPGTEVVSQEALKFCAGRVARIVPPPAASGLEWRAWAPSSDSWDAGDRSVLCVVSSPAPLTGSLEAGTAAVR